MPSNVPLGDNADMAGLLAAQQAMLSGSMRLAPIPEQPSMPSRPMPETWRAYQEKAFKNQDMHNNAPHQDLRDNPAMRHHLKAGVGPTKSSASR